MERPDPSGAVMPLMCTWENRIPEEEGKTTRGLCAPCGGPRALLGDGPTRGWVLVSSSPRVTLEVASLFTHQTESPPSAGCGLGPGVTVGAEPVSTFKRWEDQTSMGVFQKGPTWAILEERPG